MLALCVLLGLMALLVIASRFELRERLRKWWRSELDKDEKTREGVAELKEAAREAIRNKIIEMIVYGVVVKTIWSWRKAPEGTFQKLVWNLVLMAGIALGVWLVFSLLDGILNRSRERLPDYREIKSESSTE